MIVFCKTDGYNHDKSLERFGNSVEIDIPGRNYDDDYTCIYEQYLILHIYEDNSTLGMHITKKYFYIR